jgi:hypothetical protein
MRPVGLFNRLDLTPRDMSNCGQYRIVYVKNNPVILNQFFLIFEAALPNPDPGNVEGCREVAKFWYGFRSVSDDQIATALNDFYYKGGPVAGGTLNFEPVVHFKHYGRANGQVRANAFVIPEGSPWHLLEWSTKQSAEGGVVFENTPVGESPFPAFFGGSAQGVSPSDVFERLRGEFQNEFVGATVWQLVKLDLTAAEPSAPTVNGGDLINKLSVHTHKKFYAMESISGGDSARAGNALPTKEDPTRRADARLGWEIAKTLSDAKVDSACGISPIHVLNRMGAMTCGGCHRFSSDKPIAPGVEWPSSAGRGFSHITGDGLLSELLRTRFLPFRVGIVEKVAGGGMPLAPTEMNPLVATTLAKRAELARLLDSVTGGRSVTSGDFATIERLNNEVRSLDAAQPGAFVADRKPD